MKNGEGIKFERIRRITGYLVGTGHEVCDKWGDGCKTSENGFCFMAERRGEQDGI